MIHDDEYGRSAYKAVMAHALDNNPQHLWTIWRICRELEIEIPEYVLSYLDGVAEKLDPLSEKYLDKGRIENRVREAVLGEIKAPKPTNTYKLVELEWLLTDFIQSKHGCGELMEHFSKERRTILRWHRKAKKLAEQAVERNSG